MQLAESSNKRRKLSSDAYPSVCGDLAAKGMVNMSEISQRLQDTASRATKLLEDQLERLNAVQSHSSAPEDQHSHWRTTAWSPYSSPSQESLLKKRPASLKDESSLAATRSNRPKSEAIDPQQTLENGVLRASPPPELQRTSAGSDTAHVLASASIFGALDDTLGGKRVAHAANRLSPPYIEEDTPIIPFTPSKHRPFDYPDEMPKLPLTPLQMGLEPPLRRRTRLLSSSEEPRKRHRTSDPQTVSSPLKSHPISTHSYIQSNSLDCETLGPRADGFGLSSQLRSPGKGSTDIVLGENVQEHVESVSEGVTAWAGSIENNHNGAETNHLVGIIQETLQTSAIRSPKGDEPLVDGYGEDNESSPQRQTCAREHIVYEEPRIARASTDIPNGFGARKASPHDLNYKMSSNNCQHISSATNPTCQILGLSSDIGSTEKSTSLEELDQPGSPTPLPITPDSHSKDEITTGSPLHSDVSKNELEHGEAEKPNHGYNDDEDGVDPINLSAKCISVSRPASNVCNPQQRRLTKARARCESPDEISEASMVQGVYASPVSLSKPKARRISSISPIKTRLMQLNPTNREVQWKRSNSINETGEGTVAITTSVESDEASSYTAFRMPGLVNVQKSSSQQQQRSPSSSPDPLSV